MEHTHAREAKRGRLRGRKIAILATDGFEEAELIEARKALEAEHATTVLVAPKSGTIQGFHHHEKAGSVEVDVSLKHARPSEFDALVLPGGALAADHLRAIPAAIDFVRGFASVGKPIAAICHGSSTLIEADVVRGRRVTSWPSIETDLRNAGAYWVDEEVVVDMGLVTSRNRADLGAFNRRMIDEFAEGRHTGKRPSRHHRELRH